MKNRQTFSIRETAETFVPDSLGRTSYLISVVLILLMSLVITLLLKSLPVVVPLYYTQPWGEARLASRVTLYMLPGLALVFAIINLLLGRALRPVSTILSKVSAVSTAVITIMMGMALIGIIQSLTI
jgi:hypothetical protein